MNEEQQLIVETSRRIFTDLCSKEVVDKAEKGEWPAVLWKNLEDTGLTLAGIAESAGGSGGSFSDSLLVIREAATFAAPIPLAETFMAASLLARVGAKCPPGPITIASGDLTFSQQGDKVKVIGDVTGIKFAKHCEHLLLVTKDEICLVATAGLDFGDDRSLAGEHLCNISLDNKCTGERFSLSSASDELLHLGSVTRANMMAGAMTTMLNLSVQYSLDRLQFGRPISQFQAVQQQLAVMAGEVAACQRAADSVLHEPVMLDIAVAKARVGEAVASVTDIAHQVHGAMGYTMEHALNLYSRRLWDWRNEYGNETFWQRKIGEQMCASGADALWHRITSAA
jgi:acyl-CoA dehydrogenase